MSNNVIILAGGQGKRMKTNMPKVLCNVLGEPMLEWVLTACERAELDDICVVKGFEGEQVDKYLKSRNSDSSIITVMQEERLGTGHAVMMAEQFLREHEDGNTLVLCGDAPFIDEDTINGALELHKEKGCSVTVVTSRVENPTGYGRVIRGEDGLAGIVEHKDCTPAQLAITEINSGCYWFRTSDLLEVLFEIKPDNAQGEYYLTDCVELLINKGKTADAFVSENPNVALGANDRRGLLTLNDIARFEIIGKWLDEGIEFTCTDGVIIGNNVTIGRGTRIDSGVNLRGNTVIGEDCQIGPYVRMTNVQMGSHDHLQFTYAHDCQIKDGCEIGPFVHFRPNTVIGNHVKVGNYMEVKNSNVGDGTKLPHLSYIGDSDVGSGVNIGCGTITVNYDGKVKHRTTIADHAFVGCNSNLVAPVSIGAYAYVGAGSTITKDVPAKALSVGRARQRNIEGWVKDDTYKK